MNASSRSHSIQFLVVLTLIQFWWIAIWGLAYLAIGGIAGGSKSTEILIYVLMLVFTMLVIHQNPTMLDRL